MRIGDRVRLVGDHPDAGRTGIYRGLKWDGTYREPSPSGKRQANEVPHVMFDDVKDGSDEPHGCFATKEQLELVEPATLPPRPWRIDMQDEAPGDPDWPAKPVLVDADGKPVVFYDGGWTTSLEYGPGILELLLGAPGTAVAYDLLRYAIQLHRDMKWDDRCLEDDRALYTVLGEPIPDFALPPEADMLESCRRYIAQRGCPVADGALPPGKMTIAQLEAEVQRLTTERDKLIDEQIYPLGDAGFDVIVAPHAECERVATYEEAVALVRKLAELDR